MAIKISPKLAKNIPSLVLVPLVLLSVGFFFFAYEFQKLPRMSFEPEIISVPNEIPGTSLRLYRNRKMGFSLTYPGWLSYRDYADTVVFSLSTALGEDYNPSIVVFVYDRMPEQKSLSLYEYSQEAGLLIQNYESLNSIDKITTNYGNIAYKVRWNISSPRDKDQLFVSPHFTYFDADPESKKILEIRLDSTDVALEKAYDIMIQSWYQGSNFYSNPNPNKDQARHSYHPSCSYLSSYPNFHPHSSTDVAPKTNPNSFEVETMRDTNPTQLSAQKVSFQT